MSNEAKVGLLVVVVLGISVTAFLAVANFQLTGETHTYRTYFAYIGGLDAGSVVRFGGRKAGIVHAVRPWREDMTKSEVVFRLRAELPVTEDTVATIASLSALGQNYLEIKPGTIEAARIAPGGVVRAVEPLTIGDLTQKVAQVADTAVDLMASIDAKMNAVVDDLSVLMANLQELSGEENQRNIAKMLENSNVLLETQTPKIDRVLTQLGATMEEFEALAEDFRVVARSADTTVNNLNRTVDETRAPLTDSLVQLERTLVDAQLVLQDARALVLVNEGNVEEILDNFRRASEDIAELSAELRQRPWTLLRSKPKPDRQVPVGTGSGASRR